MKITRYPQSCLLIEESGTRILVDPGNGFAAKHSLEEIGALDSVIYTHEHADHFDQEIYKQLIKVGVPCLANQAVKAIAPEIRVKSDGESFNVGSIRVSPHDLPHSLMVDGSPGPQNTGFLFNGRLFHPGDGVELAGISAEILALPITGPDISLKDAFLFAKQMSSEVVIPIHYDLIGTNPQIFAHFVERFDPDLAIRILLDGESVET